MCVCVHILIIYYWKENWSCQPSRFANLFRKLVIKIIIKYRIYFKAESGCLLLAYKPLCRKKYNLVCVYRVIFSLFFVFFFDVALVVLLLIQLTFFFPFSFGHTQKTKLMFFVLFAYEALLPNHYGKITIKKKHEANNAA